MAERTPTPPRVPHPCLSCVLPDCIETDPRCGLRRAMGAYRSCVRRRQAMTPELRELKRIAYTELYGPDHEARYHAQIEGRA